MSERITALINEQQRTWHRMQEIASRAEEENREFTAEERSNWDEADQRITQLGGDIERHERMAKLETPIASYTAADGGQSPTDGRNSEERYTEALERYLRYGLNKVTDEQRDLLSQHYSEVRAQGTDPGDEGGYLVPEGFRRRITERQKAFGGIRSLANVISTSTGNNLPWPTVDDTGNEGEILDENSEAGEQDVTFGQNTLRAYTYSSKLIRVSLQLLQDAAFDLNTWLPDKIGERIGRAAAGHFADGDGSDKPQGVVRADVGRTGVTSSDADIEYNDLIELEHSVDPAYRGNAQYVMHDKALKLIRRLKDDQDRPLWVPQPAPGFPSTINGYAYTVDNKMPEPQPEAKSIAFGDFQLGYIIREVLGVQLLRLTERYAERLQVGFLGFSRMDGRIDDQNAIRVFEHGPES